MTVLPNNVLSKMKPADRAKLGKAGRTWEESALMAEVKSERILQRLINSELCRRQSEGELVFNWNRSDRPTTCKVGWPDYVVLFEGGKTLLIEAKIGNGKLSEKQKLLHEALDALQHPVYIVRSFEQFIELLRKANG